MFRRRRPVHDEPPNHERTLTHLALGLGVLVTLYFAFIYDVSVENVANIHKLNTRTIGVIIGLVIAGTAVMRSAIKKT